MARRRAPRASLHARGFKPAAMRPGLEATPEGKNIPACRRGRRPLDNFSRGGSRMAALSAAAGVNKNHALGDAARRNGLNDAMSKINDRVALDADVSRYGKSRALPRLLFFLGKAMPLKLWRRALCRRYAAAAARNEAIRL